MCNCTDISWWFILSDNHSSASSLKSLQKWKSCWVMERSAHQKPDDLSKNFSIVLYSLFMPIESPLFHLPFNASGLLNFWKEVL